MAKPRFTVNRLGEVRPSASAFDVTNPARADSARPYDAASTKGRRGSLWRPSNAGPIAVLSYALNTLRNRSRDAIRKNPYADSAVGSLVSNCIGTGIRPQWQTSDPAINKMLANKFDEWSALADADGVLNFYGLQALALRAVIEGGEVFSRKRVRRIGDMPLTVPFQLQVLEPEFCPVDRNEFIPDVRSGIEFNPIGRRTAYHMYRQHPNDWTVSNGRGDMRTAPVPAGLIDHIYQPRRPGQIRGEPWLTRALIKLWSLDKYDDHELERKRTAALFSAFVTAPDPEEFEFGGEEPADSTDTVSGEPPADSSGASKVVLEGGTVQLLEPGEEIHFASPADVGNNYEVFMRQQLRAVAVAGGTMYEILTGDFTGANDRTLRAAFNEFRRGVQMIQRNIIVHMFCRPAVDFWLMVGDQIGALEIPAQFPREELRRVRWVPQGWPYIHPEQDVKARVLEKDNLFRSRTSIVAERGEDVDDVDEEIALEREREERLGIAAVAPSTGDSPGDEREEDRGREARDDA